MQELSYNYYRVTFKDLNVCHASVKLVSSKLSIGFRCSQGMTQQAKPLQNQSIFFLYLFLAALL